MVMTIQIPKNGISLLEQRVLFNKLLTHSTIWICGWGIFEESHDDTMNRGVFHLTLRPVKNQPNFPVLSSPMMFQTWWSDCSGIPETPGYFLKSEQVEIFPEVTINSVPR